MAKKRTGKRRPRPDTGDGLLSEDRSAIKLVPAADREWWQALSERARARFAERHGKRWTEAETRQLVEADPDRNDYYELGARMGRAPGALRIRRSHMVHLLRDEYGHVAKAEAYLADPRRYHRWADIAQVYLTLKELGYFARPVRDQFHAARHLRQPAESWRGDKSSRVLRERRAAAEAFVRASRE